jgi:potassium channel subfamily K
LLAVPTLTILISNMGDTIIKAFKDFTIWIGSFTVLPDKDGFLPALQAGMERVKSGKTLKGQDLDHQGTSGASEQRGLDRLAKHIEEEELGEAEEAGEHGDYLDRDIHLYHFILVKEIRQMLKDINASPPRQYSYDEWNYYLKLIGQDESDASGHRRPEDQVQHSKGDAPDIGTADDNDTVAWSWLGIRSPLMGNTNEPEWLLHRLTATLEAEMRKMSSSDPKKKNEKPPISMAELKGRNGNADSNEANSLEKDIDAVDVRKEESSPV